MAVDRQTLRMALRDGDRTVVVGRTFDDHVPPPGELVGLAVTGPVSVYPAAAR